MKRFPYDAIASIYTNENIPEYVLDYNNRNITYMAAQWEGATPKKVKVSMEDVAKYFKYQAPSFQSVRTLANFTTDWRTVDAIAKEALEYFKALNIELLRKKCKAIGLTPKF